MVAFVDDAGLPLSYLAESDNSQGRHREHDIYPQLHGVPLIFLTGVLVICALVAGARQTLQRGLSGKIHLTGGDMEKLKGLFFDVGGTVFDWKNTARKQNQDLPMNTAGPST